jgi:hypothetical protein
VPPFVLLSLFKLRWDVLLFPVVAILISLPVAALSYGMMGALATDAEMPAREPILLFIPIVATVAGLLVSAVGVTRANRAPGLYE